MEAIILEGSPKTPTVNFNSNTGVLQLSGRSIPENSLEFYEPLYKWIEEYGNNPKPETTVNIILEYFNTSSSKCILDLFKKLEVLNHGGKTSLTVYWHYEEDDEDMLEAGEDYEATVDLTIKMVEIEEI